jgi:uncharacterized protein
MNRRIRSGLTLVAGGVASFIGGSYLAARALSRRLISPKGLTPCLARREDLLAAIAQAGYTAFDERHAGSARSPEVLATIFASPGADAAARPTILFIHGKGGNAAEWQPDALRALGLGYNVLLPDLRGHGASGGDLFTFGLLESDDLANAIDHFRARHGLDPARLGIHSCSAGSSVAIRFASRADCGALWLESPFAEPRAMARHYLAIATGFPRWSLALASQWAVDRAVARVRRELHITGSARNLEEFDPLATISRVSARICLVYGETDTLVPVAFVQKLEGALPPGSTVWKVRGAGHCHHDDEPEKIVQEEYVLRWSAFFNENLPVRGDL